MRKHYVSFKDFFESVYDDIRCIGMQEIIGVLILAIITIVVIVTLILGTADIITNETNKINSGVVVDKKYIASYVQPQKIGERYYYMVIPDRFKLCIEGQKEGKTVQYWVSVPEAEYINYDVGDKYPCQERT